MHDLFKSYFSKPPTFEKDGDYYYESDVDGDCFDETDAEYWLSGLFEKRLNQPVLSNEALGYFKADILAHFAKHQAPFVDVACGPAMGLAPLILSEFPDVLCLATDACSLLIKLWRKYLKSCNSLYNINLAACSLMDLPFKSNSVDVVTSYIGLGSTRDGESGKIKATSEVFRILKPGGVLITVENEWLERDAIAEVFRLWGRPIWSSFAEESTSWRDKFEQCGFIIESGDNTLEVPVRADDNELGEQAHKFGIPIVNKHTLYIARKP